VSQSIQVSLTKYQRLVWLIKNRSSFLTVLGAESPRSRMPASASSRFQNTVSSLQSHREKGAGASFLAVIRGTNSFARAHSHDLITPEVTLSNIITLGLDLNV
jgi:hypothetical protein